MLRGKLQKDFHHPVKTDSRYQVKRGLCARLSRLLVSYLVHIKSLHINIIIIIIIYFEFHSITRFSPSLADED